MASKHCHCPNTLFKKLQRVFMKKFVNIRAENFPAVTLSGNQIPQGETAKYFKVSTSTED
jgi:hypothetical protein